MLTLNVNILILELKNISNFLGDFSPSFLFYYLFIKKMELKLRKKDLKNYDCICFWYCEIYWLTKPLNRIGYTAGVYWWNEDVYEINGETITTGYRPTGERLNVKAWTIEKYEKKAEKIFHDEPNREKKKTKVLKLWEKLLAEVKK